MNTGAKTARKSVRSACTCEDGAIVVFGIFFAVFVLGVLYYFVGIAATIFYRERLQDAADASALASAIVHARGMNTMALINMVMAAVLSVLVTLRLIEALIIVAEAILYALSWLGGATAAAASALEFVRQEVVEITDEVEPIVQNVLKVLHAAGEVVRIITPIGSNAGVITQVSKNYEPEARLAFALPARLTLPVEDDKYDYLCGKAGIMAGKLALFPLSPILPSFVETPIEQALGKLAKAGSSWFCGDGSGTEPTGTPPDVEVQPEAPKYPLSDQQTECMSQKKKENSHEVCIEAEQFDAFSSPDPDTGECRAQKPACEPMKDPEEPGGVQPFDVRSWCGSQGQGAIIDPEEHCRKVSSADGAYMVPDRATPYGQRILMAREQCKPDGKKNGYQWKQRELVVNWKKDERGQWVQDGDPVEVQSEQFMNPKEKLPNHPCQIERYPDVPWLDQEFWPLTQEWNSDDLAKPVCIADEPKPTDPRVRTAQLRRIEVTQIVSCTTDKPPPFRQRVNPVNATEGHMQSVKPSKDTGAVSKVDDAWKNVAGANMPDGSGGPSSGGEDSKSGGQGQGGQEQDSGDNMNPFRFEKGHKLGFSDMQIRALVLGNGLGESKLNERRDVLYRDGETAHEEAKRVVMLTKWGAKGDELSGLADASEVWGMFAVAQAEYYFDTDQEDDSGFAKWKENGPRDYLWYMGWTARMRRFRLSWKVDGKSADGEEESDQSGGGNSGGGGGGFGGLGGMGGGDMGMLQKFGGDPSSLVSPEQLLQNGPKADCGGDSECSSTSSLLPSFDGLFLH